MGWGTSLIRGTKSVVGVDINAEAILEAKQRYEGRVTEFKHGDMENLEFPSSRDHGSKTPDLRQDLVRLWETVQLVLGEDHVAVDNNVENSSTPADQFRFYAGFTLDGGCQTGSPG